MGLENLSLPLLCCTSLLLVVPAQADPPKPEPLVRARQARATSLLRTARIEYSERSVTTAADGSVTERPLRYYGWKCAGNAYVADFHGDEEGVVMRDGDGRPRDDLPYNGPQHHLVKDGELWQHVEDSPLADVCAGTRAEHWRVYDLRTMGLDPVVLGRDFDVEQKIQNVSVDYSESVDADLRVVSGFIGPDECRWWIDPARGWNVVRTAVFSGGREISGMRFTLEQTDGVWFPARVEYSRQTADGRELTTIMTILSAEFNRPYHPRDLAPADIGIEPGTTLNFSNRQPPGALIWDGQSAVSAEDYFIRLERGEVTRGPTVERELARLSTERGAPGSQPARTNNDSVAEQSATRPAEDAKLALRFEPEWETYTRRFIIKYHFDDDQAQKAWKTCRQCEEQARNIVDKHRDDFQDLDRRAVSLRAATGAERERELTKFAQRRDVLVAPIERIFEQRLKPELDRLPTPEQRRIAERAPVSTQPADGEKRP
jgi:hypothetical protein